MMLYCAHLTGLNNIYKVYKPLHIYSRSTESLGYPVPELLPASQTCSYLGLKDLTDCSCTGKHHCQANATFLCSCPEDLVPHHFPGAHWDEIYAHHRVNCFC